MKTINRLIICFFKKFFTLNYKLHNNLLQDILFFIIGFAIASLFFHKTGALHWATSSGSLVSWIAAFGTISAVWANVYFYHKDHRSIIQISLDNSTGEESFIITVSNLSTIPISVRYFGTELDAQTGPDSRMIRSENEAPQSLTPGSSIIFKLSYSSIEQTLTTFSTKPSSVTLSPLIKDSNGDFHSIPSPRKLDIQKNEPFKII